VLPALNALARELRDCGLINSQRTVTGTTERISGMRDFGGGEMLPKLAVAVVFTGRFALERRGSLELGTLLRGYDGYWGEGSVYSALEISPMLKPLASVGLVAVAVSRRWGSVAKADAARARIILVNFIVSRKFVKTREKEKNGKIAVQIQKDDRKKSMIIE
jgi:hypothetical protein